MSLESSNQDSSLEDVNVKKENRPSSHLSTGSGDNPDEEEFSDDLSKLEKYSITESGKNTRDAVYWINLARA